MAGSFAVEAIPNSAILYFRVQNLHYDSETGHISSACFGRERMSVNWDKYSTAAETAAQAAKGDAALVVGLIAEFPRSLSQDVVHDPIPAEAPFGPNRAHAEIRGKKGDAIKQKLRDHAAERILWKKI